MLALVISLRFFVACALLAGCKERQPAPPATPPAPPTPVVTVPLAASAPPVAPLAPAAVELAISPDGKTLAVVELERNPKDPGPQWRAHLRPANAPTPRVELKIPDQSVRALAFSPDGKLLAVASNSTEIPIFETASGQEAHRLQQNGYVLAWGSGGLLVNETLFDPVTQKPQRELGLPPARGSKWPSPNGAFLVRTDAEPSHERPMKGGGREWIIPPARVEVVDVATGKRREIPNASRGDARVANDGTVVIPGFRVFSPAGESRDVKGVPGVGHDWTIAPNGKRAAVVDGSYTLYVVDLVTGKQSSLDKPSGRVSSLLFSPNGRELFACSSDGSVLRWALGS
jgi:WD40 repeat protein